MEKRRLTKRLIDSLAAPAGKDRVRHYDSEIPGFGVTVYASGRKAFFLQYGPEKRRRRVKLGDYGPMTPDAARERALAILAEVVKGSDPVEERRRIREVPTFKAWTETYLEEVERRKKSARNDKRYLGMAVKRWGSRTLDSLAAEDVRKVFQSMTAKGKRIDANRWLASVRACLQAAWREDKIPDNPAMKVKPNPENPPRDRVLSDDELTRLLEAVDNLEDPHVRAAFTMLIETGARLSEVLRTRWEDVDLDATIWRIPSTKSGRPQLLPLATSTAAMLRTVPRLGPWVIPGRDPDNRRSDLKKPWAALKEAAELDGVHIHDLRRTFGLHVARRAGLHVASKLLRHSDIRVTERHYAPLGLDDLRKGLEARDAVIVPLRRPKAENKS